MSAPSIQLPVPVQIPASPTIPVIPPVDTPDGSRIREIATAIFNGLGKGTEWARSTGKELFNRGLSTGKEILNWTLSNGKTLLSNRNTWIVVGVVVAVALLTIFIVRRNRAIERPPVDIELRDPVAGGKGVASADVAFADDEKKEETPFQDAFEQLLAVRGRSYSQSPLPPPSPSVRVGAGAANRAFVSIALGASSDDEKED